jgi:PIN domain nuclease of toxin-antitoxin system
MTAGLLLDTHTWMWLETKQLKMDDALHAALESAAADGNIFVCSISMLEIANGVAKKRIHLNADLETWFGITLQGHSVRILDITPAVALETMKLPRGFHGDPGDRLITATAIVEDLTLLTNDTALLRFSRQGLMKTIEVDKIRSSNAR